MTIKLKEDMGSGIIIDLTGPAGNAYALIGTAIGYAIQLGKDPNDIRERMQSGDYDNLVDVFDEEFGDIVTLLR